MVGVQAVAEGGGEELVDVAVVERPDCNRVEPEFVLVRGAVFDILGDTTGGVVGVVAGAIVPEGDVVEVGDVEGGFDSTSGAVGEGDACCFVYDV